MNNNKGVRQRRDNNSEQSHRNLHRTIVVAMECQTGWSGQPLCPLHGEIDVCRCLFEHNWSNGNGNHKTAMFVVAYWFCCHFAPGKRMEATLKKVAKSNCKIALVLACL